MKKLLLFVCVAGSFLLGMEPLRPSTSLRRRRSRDPIVQPAPRRSATQRYTNEPVEPTTSSTLTRPLSPIFEDPEEREMEQERPYQWGTPAERRRQRVRRQLFSPESFGEEDEPIPMEIEEFTVDDEGAISSGAASRR